MDHLQGLLGGDRLVLGGGVGHELCRGRRVRGSLGGAGFITPLPLPLPWPWSLCLPRGHAVASMVMPMALRLALPLPVGSMGRTLRTVTHANAATAHHLVDDIPVVRTSHACATW